MYTFLDREKVATHFMKKWENLFVSKFSFIGDDSFDYLSQTLFFRTIFRRGLVAIRKTILQEPPLVLQYWPAPVDPKLPFIGMNGHVQSGYGYPAWKNYTRSGTTLENIINTTTDQEYRQTLTLENAVFFQHFLGEDYIGLESLETLMTPYANQLSEMYQKVYELNTVLGGKLVIASAPNIQRQINNIFDLDSFITLSESTNVGQGIDETMNENMEKQLTMLKFDTDIKQLLENIIQYEKMTFRIFGFRTNQHFKKSRLITGELESAENEFKGYEFRFHEALNDFVLKYNILNNTEMVLIDNLLIENEKGEDKEIDEINNDEEKEEKEEKDNEVKDE